MTVSNLSDFGNIFQIKSEKFIKPEVKQTTLEVRNASRVDILMQNFNIAKWLQYYLLPSKPLNPSSL